MLVRGSVRAVPNCIQIGANGPVYSPAPAELEGASALGPRSGQAAAATPGGIQ
jgi:hypothetical protein